MKPNNTLDPELYKAAREGNTELLEELFMVLPHQEQGEVAVSITNNAPSEPNKASCLSGVTCAGDTALHIAAYFGQIEVAMKICKKSISLLTRTNNKSETPLHYAAQAGNPDLVKDFIKLACEECNNINLDELLQKRNQDGETALYHAVRHQHEEVAKELMSADVHSATIPDYQNISPLYLATMLGSLPIVTYLVQQLLLLQDIPRGAYSGPGERTVLHDAALSGKTSFVEKFLEWRPELLKATDNSGYTPLHYASSMNNVTVAKMLLETDKTSAYAADSSGLCPVHVAAILGYLKVVIELFNHCPDSDQLLDSQGRNFLHLAVKEKRVGIVQWVCKNIVDFEKAINAQDNEGNTPLHLAVKTRDPTVVCHLLLSRRAPLNWVNKNELTPLDIADEQIKDGFSDMKNADYVIYNTLYEIGCCRHKRGPNFHLELENDQQKDEEKEKKEMESCESMAKSMSIGSVLIASAAFAAAFTVYGVYINKQHLNDNPDLKLVFEVFFLLDAYAFLCAIIVTGLLVEAALNFVDLEYRKRYLFYCSVLIMMAAKCFIIAFTTAAYVILTPVRKWLAILIYVMGTIAPILIQPRHWPNLLVLRTLIRYGASIRSFGILAQLTPLFGNGYYIFIVSSVLYDSLNPWRKLKVCGTTSCSDQDLPLVIYFLLFITLFSLFVGVVKERTRKPRTKIRMSLYIF